MQEDNFYAPPQAPSNLELAPTPEFELASRWARLFAAILDSVFLGLVVVAPIFFLGYMEPDAAVLEEPLLSVVSIGAVMGAHLLLNGYLLATRGQSLGKCITGIRIVSYESGELLPLSRLMFARFLPTIGIANLPGIGDLFSLVDSLFIFRTDRRCIHDLIAGTQVVKAS